MDEAECGNPGEVIIPLMTYNQTLRQLILAGDPKQLPLYAITQEGKNQYKVLPVEFLINRGFPATLLNRIYQEASDPVGHIISNDKVRYL